MSETARGLISGDDVDPFAISGTTPPPPADPLDQPYPHTMPGRSIDD